MAKLRNIQFLRNNTIAEPFISYGAARTAAESAFGGLELQDGEIALYSYKLTTTGETVHTLFGIKRDGGIEILGNYDELTAEYQSYVTDAIEDLDGSATIATQDENGVVTLKTGIVQTNGIVANITDDEGIELAKVATTGKAEDVTIADTGNLITATNVEGALAELVQKTIDITVAGKEAIEVGNAETPATGKVVSLKIANSDKVLSQNADGLLANIVLSYDTEADTDGKKYIRLTGKDNADLGKIDATDFIKDGMLDSATIVKGTWTNGTFTETTEGKDSAIKLVWNTDAGKNAMYINAETLVDSYTAGNEWIVIDQNTNKISHKTQTNFSAEDATKSFGGNVAEGTTADVTLETAGNSIEFNVPSFTVDAAGHVTVADDKTVKVTLPDTRTAATVTVSEITGLDAENVQDALAELQGDINAINAVNWNGDGDTNEGVEGAGEIIVNDTNHTISHKKHTVTPTQSTNDTAVTSVVIPQLTVNDYGHITAIDNKTFNIDFNIPTVTGTEGQIVVTPEGTKDVEYTVSLAKVVNGDATNVTPTEDEDDYAREEGTTHTRVENITVDAYGRVTAYTLTTVEENFDAGTY